MANRTSIDTDNFLAPKCADTHLNPVFTFTAAALSAPSSSRTLPLPAGA